MTTQLEQAARLALEALEKSYKINGYPENKKAINALRAALEQPAQDCQHCGGTGDVSGEYPGVACPECTGTGVKTKPEFIKHEVENAEDWSEWVCPDPKGYLMECCDCGLVHEAEFMVVRYKSETEREVCEPVDDPNLQAVFRMRRSEQWSPVDTAHRAGGLPMEQPAQDEPVALETVYETIIQWDEGGGKRSRRELARRIVALYTRPQQPAQDEPVAYKVTGKFGDICSFRGGTNIKKGDLIYTRPQAREPQPCPYVISTREGTHHCSLSQHEPLTPQSPCEMTQSEYKMFKLGWLECEAAHGIGEKQ